MPGAKEETITKLENAINQMPVSKLIEQGLTPEGILNEILGEENVQILETMDAQFECNCSHEKFLNAIKGLGEAEIEDMIKEDHGLRPCVISVEINIIILKANFKNYLIQ